MADAVLSFCQNEACGAFCQSSIIIWATFSVPSKSITESRNPL
jgi:hypothetical protein